MLENLGTGGPIIAVLLVLSIASIAVIVLKTAQLWRVTSGQAARDAAFEAFEQKGAEAGASALPATGSPADRVLAQAMQAIGKGQGGQPLLNDLTHRGNEEVARMNSHIRFLELVAMISPLLGLLGTVLGMIQSFQELELAAGSANASVLAGGIWQALLTTAAGLLVAIPAAVGASLLAGRAERGAQAIESAVARLMLIATPTAEPR